MFSSTNISKNPLKANILIINVESKNKYDVILPLTK